MTGYNEYMRYKTGGRGTGEWRWGWGDGGRERLELARARLVGGKAGRVQAPKRYPACVYVPPLEHIIRMGAGPDQVRIGTSGGIVGETRGILGS